MKQYLVALDEGTTSARCILFDREGRTVSVSQHEIPQYFPQPGYVEQDAMEIFGAQTAALCECIASSGVDPSEIAAIGITNQRETTVVWDKKTGIPICPAIVWQCRRTTGICERLSEEGHGVYIAEATGLRPDAYFSGTKIRWILDNVPGAQARAERGELLFGTVDTWLVWKLTGGRVHVTDRTNASRTMLYNIKKEAWDETLLSVLRIPRAMLPEVKSSSEVYGEISLSGVSVPISGIAGDQQSALFGQGCFFPGEAKNTYGTGCFLLANTGTTPVASKNGLLTTVAATEAGRPTEYALEGSVFVGGAVVKWLRDKLCLIQDAAQTEAVATSVPDNGGVYIVPAFTGLGAPHWNMHARGTIVGLTSGAGRAHLVRAALESIAYQTNDVLRAMEADFGKKISTLKVDGGGSANAFLMQFQSDVSNTEVFRPVTTKEATALGAAFLAGLGVGFFRNREEIAALIGKGNAFRPQMKEKDRKALLDGWGRAVSVCEYGGNIK